MKRNIGILLFITLMMTLLSFAGYKNSTAAAGTTIKTMTVHNAEQLVDALKPNTIIILLPGKYDLNDVNDKSPYFKNKCISNLKNLTIQGNGKTYIDFITADLFKPVIQFKNCEKVVLRNLNIGHVPAQEGCQGNVVEISGSKNITIDKCMMFGCGINGISLRKVQGFNCTSSNVKECSESILSLHESQNVLFESCNFHDNKGDYIYTGDCKEVQFKNCIIIGKEMMPQFEDDNQYAVLTNEGTISGEFSEYSSAYVDQFEDWLSGVTLQNVWISTRDNYDYHRKNDGLLRKILGKTLIATNMTRNSWEIKLNIAKNELKYSNVCNYISKLAQSKDLFKDKRVKGVSFKFYTGKSNVLNITATQANLIKYLSENNPQNLENYSKLIIFFLDVQPSLFWEKNVSYLSGKDVIEKLSDLLEIKTEVEDENYVNGPEFQRFSYKGAVKEKGQLLHFVELEQKLPLLGDYIHYITFAELTINASTGEVIIKEPLIGESRVSKIEEDVKEYIITSVKDRQFESNGVKLGKVEADKSLFIVLKNESDTKVVKVQLYTDEGGNYYVIFTLKKQETGWSIVNEQIPDLEQEDIGD